VAVPKRRKSKSKSSMRWAHEAIDVPNLRPCPNCGAYGLPHRVCPSCMQYKGKQVRLKKAVVTEA
jgi:large subunit ribosomal protein L32